MQSLRAFFLHLVASSGIVASVVFLITTPAFPQATSSHPNEEQTTLRSSVRVVLIDVVVTDNKKDEPVTALPKEQFEVFEDGKPQTLVSFEEHAGVPDVPALSRMAHLPPNVFSNAPLAKAGDAANILLLDSLNTEIGDQSYVHSEMIKYIKDVRPGTRLAIFTLSDRLRFVQGFTEDPALLMAAVNGKKSAGNPELSSLLQTASEQNANLRAVDQMSEMAAATGSASLQAAAAALANFQRENLNSQIGTRVKLTLEAIEQLAMYLQAIPGRKNVIWFSGSFPLSNLSMDQNQMVRQYGEEIAKTANLLVGARIAIYPIGVGAMGLAPNRMYDFSAAQPSKIASAQSMTRYQTNSLDAESTERVQNEASLQELAFNTGEQYFLNTNGFNDVLDHVLKTGTHYYTLTYSPTNRKMDGQLRKIVVKVGGGKYHLAYRRGYYATDELLTATKSKPSGDPLRPLMEHGTPDSTEILYTLHVAPAATPPGQRSAHAGDKQDLKEPVTRYTITCTVSPENLDLAASADGMRHGNIEVTVLLYDRDGAPVNWLVRMLQVPISPEHYAQVQANGIAFHLEIDAPANAAYLRSGLYDLGSNKAGTIEIPLAAVAAEAVSNPAPPPMPEHELEVTEISLADPVKAAAPSLPQMKFSNFASCPIAEIQQVVPELAHLKAAQDQSQLATLLEKIGAETVKTARKMPNLVSHEAVVSEQNGSTDHAEYSFLILQHATSKNSGIFDEYRVDVATGEKLQTDFIEKIAESSALAAQPSLQDLTPAQILPYSNPHFTPASQGATSAWLYFYPPNQSQLEFRYLGQQKINGSHTLVVAFAQKPESVSFPAVIVYNGQIYKIFLQGVAWIDPAEFRIERLRTNLLSVPGGIPLSQLSVDIQFGQMPIVDLPSPLWLPTQVVITTNLGGSRMYERHRYSNYHLFRAQSKIVLK
jgi:VWFA-related protein